MSLSTLVPAIDQEAPKELHAAAKAIATEFAKVVRDNAKLGQDIDALRDRPPADLDPAAPVALQRRKVQLIQREIELCQQCMDLEERHRAALTDICNAAGDAIANAEKSVRKKLASIGYRDLPVTDPDRSKITPDMIHRHPDVRAAKDRFAEVSLRRSNDDSMRRNENRFIELSHELARYRERMLAV